MQVPTTVSGTREGHIIKIHLMAEKFHEQKNPFYTSAKHLIHAPESHWNILIPSQLVRFYKLKSSKFLAFVASYLILSVLSALHHPHWNISRRVIYLNF